MARCRLVSVAACLLLASACGEDNLLEGSVSGDRPLTFDRVSIRLQESWLVITYFEDHPAGTEKVCKVVVDTTGLPSGEEVVLEGEEFIARVHLQRATFDDHGFPFIESGRLELDEFEVREGGDIAGEIFVLFETGQTLNARFQGVLTVVAVPA